jgi:hypothetical protein
MEFRISPEKAQIRHSPEPVPDSAPETTARSSASGRAGLALA